MVSPVTDKLLSALKAYPNRKCENVIPSAAPATNRVASVVSSVKISPAASSSRSRVSISRPAWMLTVSG